MKTREDLELRRMRFCESHPWVHISGLGSAWKALWAGSGSPEHETAATLELLLDKLEERSWH